MARPAGKSNNVDAAHFVVAIDGPSGAGKSTIARLLAERLGIDYVDTGAMYRAVALASLRGTPLDSQMEGIDVDLDGSRVLLNGEDVSGLIRTAEVTKEASRISQFPEVRARLVALQREMGARKSVVMDGRDIGSNVFPDARYKFYLTATPEERARRRTKEMREKGMDADYAAVLADIEKRDWDDSHRAVNPLVKTADAVEIVTDGLGIDEVLARVLEIIK
ncbi:MAG: (d)CMP kinase [Clostridiales Family XIII bacterium]|jgi:cytidylate kinase|nr:(d)CMP kinase [Clostridiales Family XIII bacterium]